MKISNLKRITGRSNENLKSQISNFRFLLD